MDVGQVYFSIEANGLEKVLSQAQQLESVLNNLDHKKFAQWSKDASRAQRDADMHAQRTARVNEINARAELTNEKKLGIEQANNDKHHFAELKKYNEAYKTAARVRVDAEKAATKETTESYKTAIKGAQTMQKMSQNVENHRLKAAKAAVGLRSAELKLQKQTADIGEQNASTLQEMQQKMEANIVHFGSRMQTLGMTLQRITQPFADVFRGIAYSAGYKALNTFTSGLSSGFSRYDTMKKYPKIMAAFGYSGKKAQKSIDALDFSVRGLPTGLDEIVDLAQRFTATTGDITKGTKLAIAANNAFLASMSTDTQKYQGMMQLQDVLGGKDMQPREWNSLVSSMTPAIVKMGESLGYSSKNMSEWIQQVRDGKVDNQKFINTLIEIGNEGGILEKMAAESKDTWQAFFANVGNASSRMTAGILKALDEISQAAFGKDVNRLFSDTIIPGIDGMTESVKQWIKAHPEEIKKFFDDLASIDFKGIISEFAGFAKFWGDVYLSMVKLFGGRNIIHAALVINSIGRILAALGGLSKGLAGPLSKLGTYGFGGLIGLVKALTYAGKHSKPLLTLGKHSKAIAKAADTAGGMVLTWQGVANKILNIGSIYVVAQAVKVVSEALQNLNGVKFSPDLVGTLGTAVTITGLLTKFVTGMGTVIGASKTAMLGTAIGTTAFYGITKGIEALGNAVGRMGEGIKAGADALDKVNKLKVPKSSKVAEISSALKELAKAFATDDAPTSLGTAINAWSKGLQADNIIKISDAMDSIKNLSKIKISDNAIEKAKENFQTIQEFSVDLMSLFDEEEQAQMDMAGGTSRAFKKGSHTLNPTSFAEWKNKIRDFADTISTMSAMFTDLDATVTGIKTLNKSYRGLGEGAKATLFWDTFKQRMKTFANALYDLAGNDEESPLWKMQQAASKLEGASYTKVTEAINEIPNIINAMNKVGEIKVEDIHVENLDDLGTKISEFITKISSAFNTGGFGGGAQGFALDVSGFYSAVNGVKEAVNALNDIPVVKDMSGVVTSVQNAITKLREIGTQIINVDITITGGVHDAVGPAITAAAKAITDALDSIKKTYKKKVKVTISGTVDDQVTSKINAARRAIASAVARIPSTIDKSVTVRVKGSAVSAGVDGMQAAINALNNSQHGGRVYRAGGGSLRRGTDTIPAMLTRGEYVINRNATNILGDDVLSKLNHLDIRGALNSLSLRAGQIQSRTINNNSTKNANVTVNNYHSDGVGYGRASRFVRGL